MAPCSLSLGACPIVPGSSSPHCPVVLSDLRVGVPAAGTQRSPATWQQALRAPWLPPGDRGAPVRAGLRPLRSEVLVVGVWWHVPVVVGSDWNLGASPRQTTAGALGDVRTARVWRPGKAFREPRCRTFRVCVLELVTALSAAGSGVGGPQALGWEAAAVHAQGPGQSGQTRGARTREGRGVRTTHRR